VQLTTITASTRWTSVWSALTSRDFRFQKRDLPGRPTASARALGCNAHRSRGRTRLSAGRAATTKKRSVMRLGR
jgi:hypothetical protein